MKTSTAKISFLVAFAYVCSGTLFALFYSFKRDHSNQVLNLLFQFFAPISIPIQSMFADNSFPYVPLLIIDGFALGVLWLFSALLIGFFRDVMNSRF